MKRYRASGPVLRAVSSTVFGVLLSVAPAAIGLPSDRQQPIQVTADSAVQEGDQVTYTGDVVIVQGSLRIDADQVVVHNQDRKVQRMVATGDRAHLQQLPEPGAALVKARARIITYIQAQDLIVLETEAEVEQKGSIVTGQRIEYLVPTQTVRAQGGAGQGDSGRVQMVLQPESDAAVEPAPEPASEPVTEPAPQAESQPEPPAAPPGPSSPSLP